MGEAISNAWDADASNVYITINKEQHSFSIFDDGTGMSQNDFQDKFLKVGYSKRADGNAKSKGGRPFIGRKGIGKLALLSCSEKVHILSKVKGGEIIGGVINNKELDNAIKEDNSNYELDNLSNIYSDRLEKSEQGTFLLFENIKNGIKNTTEYLRTIIAMYFRFSTIDSNFHIFVNEKEVTVDDLQSLIDNTEFVWNINNLENDKFLDKIKDVIKLPEEKLRLLIDGQNDSVKGFIASVNLPSNISIRTTGEKVTIDLFVNGRLREKDIMKHISTNRIAESYLYGQINYNSLDSGDDPFTSSRESVKEDNQKFQDFLKLFRSEIINNIINRWDELRDKRGKDGDFENPRITKKQRKAKELFNATSEEYRKEVKRTDPLHNKMEEWLEELKEESSFNYPCYSECFLSENLTRKFIDYKKMPLSKEIKNEAKNFRETEKQHKETAGINIDIRQYNNDLGYLDMTQLAKVAEPGKGGVPSSLHDKAKEFRPIRNAVMHTALVSQEAKMKLTTVFNEIKARLKYLLKVG